MFDSLVFCGASPSLDISCEKATISFRRRRSCFVFAPSYNAIARVRSRSKCFLCIFIYFMTIAAGGGGRYSSKPGHFSSIK